MKNLSYEDFCVKMQSSLQEYYGSQIKVNMQEVEKNNGVKLIGITIHLLGCNIMPTMYLESFYELYMEGMEFSKVISVFIEKYDSYRKDDVEMDFFSDYEKVKKMLSFKLINFEMNREFLEKVPFRSYLDLAIIFQCHICNEVLGNGTITVRNEHLKMWGITENQLWQDAMENMPRLYPTEFMNMAQMLKNIYEDEDGIITDELPLFVLSNINRVNGASSLLYENQLENIAEKVKDDYYILPSSIHELLILPKKYGTDEAELSRMVDEINQTHVEYEEILSNHAYFYASGTKKLISLPLIPKNEDSSN